MPYDPVPETLPRPTTSKVMTWDVMTCAKCGEPVAGVVESLLTESSLTAVERGFEYAGESEMFWDTQEKVLEDGKHSLRCVNGHEWQARPCWMDPAADT